MELAEEIAVELGRPLTDAEASQAALWIDDLTNEVRARFGDDSMPQQVLLDRVIRIAVATRLRSPDPGLSQTQVSVDDATVIRRYEAGSAARMLTHDLWAMLGWVEESGICTIRPSFESDCIWPEPVPAPWWL